MMTFEVPGDERLPPPTGSVDESADDDARERPVVVLPANQPRSHGEVKLELVRRRGAPGHAPVRHRDGSAPLLARDPAHGVLRPRALVRVGGVAREAEKIGGARERVIAAPREKPRRIRIQRGRDAVPVRKRLVAVHGDELVDRDVRDARLLREVRALVDAREAGGAVVKLVAKHRVRDVGAGADGGLVEDVRLDRRAPRVGEVGEVRGHVAARDSRAGVARVDHDGRGEVVVHEVIARRREGFFRGRRRRTRRVDAVGPDHVLDLDDVVARVRARGVLAVVRAAGVRRAPRRVDVRVQGERGGGGGGGGRPGRREGDVQHAHPRGDVRDARGAVRDVVVVRRVRVHGDGQRERRLERRERPRGVEGREARGVAPREGREDARRGAVVVRALRADERAGAVEAKRDEREQRRDEAEAAHRPERRRPRETRTHREGRRGEVWRERLEGRRRVLSRHPTRTSSRSRSTTRDEISL